MGKYVPICMTIPLTIINEKIQILIFETIKFILKKKNHYTEALQG